MKRSYLFLVPALVLASCGGGQKDPAAQLASLKEQRAKLDAEITKLEAGKHDSTAKVTPVSVMTLQPATFRGEIEVQSQITGDEVVNAYARNNGTVNRILVKIGQQVHKGQVLATLDADVADQQVNALEPQIELAKALYEKQQKLWAQNIGTEVQLMSAKTNYDNLLKQKAVAQAARNLNNIVSPINGVVDDVSMKVGQPAMLGTIRVVNTNKLKAEANLGENYLGKVKVGDKVILMFPDNDDSLTASISYVSKAVDALSRSFMVQINLGDNKKLHPNMSCIMRIVNYEKPEAIAIPVSVIQKTAEGEMVYVVDGDKARSVVIRTGRNSNGKVEVVDGLKAGEQLVVAGFEDLDSGEKVTIE